MIQDLDLFVRISRLLPNLHGWCPESKAHTLAAAVIALRPEVSLEIGIWGGRSFLPLAMAHKHVGKGYVIGIDPWHPVESAKGQENPADARFWSGANHDQVYSHFMQNLHEMGLENCTRIYRQPSDRVDPPARIDLLHVDGNHSDQALRDVERFAPKVRSGGLVFMDDIGWTGGGVQRAVDKLRGMGWSRLYDIGTGAVFQRA